MEETLALAKKLLWALEEEMSLLTTDSSVEEVAVVRRAAQALVSKLSQLQMEAPR